MTERQHILDRQPDLSAPVRFLKMVFGVSAEDRAIAARSIEEEARQERMRASEIDGSAAARRAAINREAYRVHVQDLMEQGRGCVGRKAPWNEHRNLPPGKFRL